MTKERPWHIEISEERVECCIELLAFRESSETGASVPPSQIAYRGDNINNRSFWIDNQKIAAFDMWGNLVIYNPDN
ncbi:MAG TPA: hypothetical protein EYO84_06875 [Planctomycetes bacterium]|nr:hypothetical protein [Planctomycetota bacterium]